ncbi:chemotaxis protein CheB [Dactylosporangium sp. NPDC051485]|uniref:chemotaxis protein CheB n=1 Tax=Dactylosporangium sp. NPDC051485 TaxID=3154846 RepID=UPI00343FC3D9
MTDPRGLVVVGASAGGVEALRAFAGGLPAGFEAGVCVVLHIPRRCASALAPILRRSGPLPAVQATDGMAIGRARIHVAPPNAHLLVNAGRLRLSHGPAENGHRPAVDPLFRSAARWWGAEAIGVVLSGNRDDGAYGLAEIARQGGTALVQDPDEALYPSMPRHAAARAARARAVPAAGMGPALTGLLAGLPVASPRRPAAQVTLDPEEAMAAMEDVTTDEIGDAPPAGFGCPTCHGALFELPGPGHRFRCRVGHAWSAAGLLDELGASLEGALWMALRSLEEKAALNHRMAESALGRGDGHSAERFGETARDSQEAGRSIRRLIARFGALEDGDRVDEPR